MSGIVPAEPRQLTAVDWAYWSCLERALSRPCFPCSLAASSA